MPTLFDDFVTPDSDAVVTGSITLVSPDLRDDGAGNTMTRIGYPIKVVAGHFAVTDVPAGPYIATWELFAGNGMMDASIGDGRRPRTVVVEAVSTPQRFRTLLSVAPVADSPASVLRQIVDDWLADNAPDDLLSKTVADATYAPVFPTTGITYDGSGNVQTVTENGVTTTYTYNPDGSVATDTRDGVTRTYGYDGNGNLTSITVED